MQEIVKKVMKHQPILLLHNWDIRFEPKSHLENKMLCPYLRDCFRESINRKHEFFEKERCTHEEKWSRCPVFREKRKGKGLLEMSTYPERTT